jgi:hypothetical protein
MVLFLPLEVGDQPSLVAKGGKHEVITNLRVGGHGSTPSGLALYWGHLSVGFAYG